MPKVSEALAYVCENTGKPVYIAGAYYGNGSLLDTINDAANIYSRNFEEYSEIWNYLIEEITPEMFMLIKAGEV